MVANLDKPIRSTWEPPRQDLGLSVPRIRTTPQLSAWPRTWLTPGHRIGATSIISEVYLDGDSIMALNSHGSPSGAKTDLPGLIECSGLPYPPPTRATNCSRGSRASRDVGPTQRTGVGKLGSWETGHKVRDRSGSVGAGPLFSLRAIAISRYRSLIHGKKADVWLPKRAKGRGATR